jgi:single-strand DNA-binding protein
MSMNLVILIGRLGNDPDYFTFENGTKVARMSLATTKAWTDKNSGEKIKRTEWHRVSVWGAQADVAHKYCKKGDLISIRGEIRTNEYEKDGQKKYSTEIKADELILIGSGKSNKDNDQDSRSSHSDPRNDEPKYAEPQDEDDDIPF